MNTIRIFIALILACGYAPLAENLWGTTLNDLAVGEQYRLIFVTKDPRKGDSDDIATYDTFVTDQAGLSGLTSSYNWQAMISTQEGTNARTHTGTSGTGGVPIYQVHADPTMAFRIATDYGDLWDNSIENPIRNNQFGNSQVGSFAYTGTNALGATTGPLSGSTNVGDSDATDKTWMRTTFSIGNSATESYRFYAISEIITKEEAVIPEPSTYMTLGAMLGVAALLARRRSLKGESPTT